MFSIFSNYLKLLGVEITDETKVSEHYAMLRNIHNQGATCVTHCPRTFVSGDEKLDFDIIYAICTQLSLRKLLYWVNNRIVLCLGITDYRAIDVRLRIFTSQLNQLVDQKIISCNLAYMIHKNLTSNIRREMSAINTEDLPF